jgi:hypothetical protein
MTSMDFLITYPRPVALTSRFRAEDVSLGDVRRTGTPPLEAAGLRRNPRTAAGKTSNGGATGLEPAASGVTDR